MMMRCEIDIPKLNKEGIEMGIESFDNVKELNSSSMIEWLLMIEMLIVLIYSLERRWRMRKAQIVVVSYSD